MYNVKLVEYPNGTALIMVYSCCMAVDTNKQNEAEYETEPFTNTKARCVEEFATKNEEDSLRRSLARTKSIISNYARSNTWDWFVTFTYDKAKTDRTDFKECMRKCRVWLNNARRKAPNLKYLAVPELHADGKSWHCHLLLSNTGSIEFVDSHRRKNGKAIFNITNWRWGFSTATKITDTKRVSKYILKYITKDAHALQKHAHRYYVSRNLKLPVESTFLISPEEQEDFIKELVDSLGCDIVWDKEKQNSYTSVRYIELE